MLRQRKKSGRLRKQTGRGRERHDEASEEVPIAADDVEGAVTRNLRRALTVLREDAKNTDELAELTGLDIEDVRDALKLAVRLGLVSFIARKWQLTAAGEQATKSTDSRRRAAAR